MDLVLDAIPFWHKRLLSMLQNLAPIAGSSVTLPRMAQDIDLWVLREDQRTWKRVIALLTKYRAQFSVPKVAEEYKDRSTCLVTAMVPRETMPIQVIFTKFASVEALLDSFDMDYIRGACFQGRIVWNVGESHAIRQVLTLYDANVKIKRWRKAMLKGFRCPVLANDAHIYPKTDATFPSEIKDGKDIMMVTATMHETSSIPLNLTSLQITGLQVHHEWRGRNKHPTALCKYYRFQINDGPLFRFVSIRVNIIRTDQREVYTEGLPKYVRLTTERAKVGPRGPNVLVVEMSCSGHGNIRFHVLDMDLEPELVMPIDFAPSFWDACERIRYWFANPLDAHCEVVDNVEWVRLELLRLSGKDRSTERDLVFYGAYRAYEYAREQHLSPSYAPKTLAWDYQKRLHSTCVRDKLGYVGPDWTCFGSEEPPRKTFATHADAASFLRKMWIKY